MEHHAEYLINRLSLRRPQAESLNLLTKIADVLSLQKDCDLAAEQEKIITLMSGLATDTGKARLAPACLRQAVKASFDAPAPGQCVTSVKNLKYNVNNNNLPNPHAMLIIRPDQMQSFTDRIRAQFAAKLTGQLQADYPGLFQPLPPPLALRMVSGKIDYAEYRYEIRFQSALTVFLSRSDLPRANLSEANLGGAILSEANLGGAILSDANLDGVIK